MIIVVNSDQFGKNLNAMRRKRKMTQKALAQACGISVYRIRYLEWGRIRDVEDFLMEDICAALDCTREELLHPAV